MGCPVCGKPVDAVRARFVRVVAGQVIAYCSNECKSQETEAVGNVLRTGRSGPMPVVSAATIMTAAEPPASSTTPDTGAFAVPVGEVDNAVTAPQVTPPALEPAVLVDTSKKLDKAAKSNKSKIIETPNNPVIPKAAAATAQSDVGSLNLTPITGDKSKSKAEGTPIPVNAKPLMVPGPLDTNEDVNDGDDVQAIARQRRNWMIAVVAAVVVISILAIWKIVGSTDLAPATKLIAPPVGINPVGSASAGVVVAKPVATGSAELGTDPTVQLASALVQAQVALNDMLKSKSLRLRRMAAAALARTGDETAMTALASVSAEVEGDLAKAEIAYAMARGGNAKGRDELAQRMNTTRRDAKADAARLLAQLGDPRAIPVLKDFLDITQHSLSAAEQLARSKDPSAIPALQKIMAKPELSSDEKSRVTIALAVAGQGDVIPAVEQMLSDQRFNHGAAVALAALGKGIAARTLRDQLGVAALRVQAARSLRLLSVRDPSVAVAESLPGLLVELKADKDTARASAAEALLLLTGDPAWGAYE
jgi:HEAT repeat protein/YHS domain-containing protein